MPDRGRTPRVRVVRGPLPAAPTISARTSDTLGITRWRGLTATRGEFITTTWNELSTMLSTPAPRPSDPRCSTLAGWSSARFTEHQRSKDRVESVTALVVDIDTGALELEALREAFDGQCVLVHNTRSAEPGAQCWRVVLATSRPMTPAEHAKVWASERDRLALLGIVLDEQTKDPSRFWFVPCVPLAGDFLFDSLAGAPLDVDAVLANVSPLLGQNVERVTPAASGPISRSSPSAPAPPRDEPGWLAAISLSTRKRRAAAWVASAAIAIEGQRGSNDAMRVATAIVRGFALDRASALEVLSPWNDRCEPPWSPSELAHKVDEAERVGALTWGAKLEEQPKGATLHVLPLPGDDGTPIRIGVDLDRVVDDGVRALTRDTSVYQRDGQLVHVVRVPETEADAATLAGAPQIRPLAMPTLRERLAGVARWEKLDGRSEKWKPATPTDAVVSAVASRGMWKGIRPIVGVIEAPSLRPDGSVIQRAGYDPVTGFVLVPGEDFPVVPDAPTQEDARRALEELSEPFADFPYPNEAHRAATLAAVLTVIARPAIVGAVPAFIFDASTPGSGKTLQADIVSLIATGRISGGMGFPTDDEELEKILGGYAIRGAMLINFDNVTRPFGGGPLDKCITASDCVDLRVLGRSEVPTLRWRATLMATGNNVELVGDTARRVLFSRLEPRVERPEDRTDFRIRDLRGFVRRHRARLVTAALTLLRAHAIAGRPNPGTKSWGSFEAWAATIPAALVWAGAADPMATRPSVDDGAVEPQKAALVTVLGLLPRLAGDDGMTAKRLLQALYPAGREPDRSNGPPDAFDDLREALEMLTGAQHGKPPTPVRVGYALRRAKGRTVQGRHLDGATDRNGIVRWRVVVAPASPASLGGGTAGDAGDEGLVFPHAGEDQENKSRMSLGPAGETSPATPASPADEGADGPFSDLLEGR